MAKVKVHIKSLAVRPGTTGMYKPGSVQVLEAQFGRSLVAAGIAIMFEDPVVSAVPVSDDGSNNDEKGTPPTTIDGSEPVEEEEEPEEEEGDGK